MLNVAVEPERIVLTDGLQPFLFRTAGGTLVVQGQMSFPPGYRRPSRNAYPGLPGTAVSRDGGGTWTRWRPTEAQGIGPIFEGAATHIHDGTVLILEWIADGPTAAGSFDAKLWESQDEFHTVEGPAAATVHLPLGVGGFDDGGHPYSGVTFHRTLLELPGGDLLAAIYCWFQGDDTPCTYLPKMRKFRCVLLRSADRGRHWDYVSTIAVNPEVGQEGFDEPVMVSLRSGSRAGRLLCLMRTGSTSCPIYRAWSDDGGRTWCEPRPLGFCGVDPDLIEMADGTLACSFGWRTADWASGSPSPEHGNYVIFSRDQGETWEGMTRFPFEPHGPNHSTCYTSIREIAPRTLLVAYDIGSWGGPVRYVAARKVKVELI